MIHHQCTRTQAILLATFAFLSLLGCTRSPAGDVHAPALIAAASQQPAEPGASAVVSIGITVGDLDKALEFYTGVLTFKKVSEREIAGENVERLLGVFGARARVATLTLGSESIELTQYLAPEGRPIPADSRSNDLWFQHIAIVVSNMDAAYRHLRAHNVRHASTGPQTLPAWNTNAAGISAFYFKDPDGHALEIIHFPAGKGDPRWQQPSQSLFLGIDHTAIVVGDTERSLAFYRDVLGLRVAGESENFGTEQEHLNNVFGARLRITALRAPTGPGVELLEYLAPGGGRPYPLDVRANDLVHWHTSMSIADPALVQARLRAAHASWVSPGFIAGADASTMSAAQVRDPDGHTVMLLSNRPSPDAAAAVASKR
jgi:catechol 2,3-dioxygenase-like lactoylglutathione lyase family enzyme